MARPEKVAVVDEIAEKIKRTQSLFLTDFTGLDVEAINELRLLLRENAVEYRVVKNTLARLAADQAGREDLKPFLVGPTAMAFGFEDPVLPAKLLSRFAQKTGKPSVKAILFEGQLFGQETMDRLKVLPSHEELLAQILGGLKAPMMRTVMVLTGLLRNLLNVLDAISQKRAQEEGAKKEEGEVVREEAEEKVEQKAEKKDEGEKRAAAKGGIKAEAKVEDKPEEKPESETEVKGGEAKEEDQRSAEKTEPELNEGESQIEKSEGQEEKAADSQKPPEAQTDEKKPENKQPKEN
jgi:large subunit ribosomal protein L10